MLVFNMFLALAWVALTGGLTAGNFLAGFVVGYGIIWITRDAIGARGYVTKVPQVIRFSFYLLKLFASASFRVTMEIITPANTMRPGILAIPLDATTETEILLLASLITLMPGSFALDVSPDRRVLYVHDMYVGDPERARAEIKQGIERRLLEVLR
jgi:multicomponent Na+:H+ antiporter subunit E